MDAEVLWYYMQGGNSQGPETLHRLLELLEDGVVNRATLVMRSGGTEWQSLDQALALDGHAPPPPPGSPGIATPLPALNAKTARIGAGNEQHPWRRYFARLIDLMIGGFGMWFLIAFVLNAIDQDAAKALTDFLGDSRSRVVDGMGTMLLAIFPNALMIGYTGTSIGKWLFGIRVTGQDDLPIGIGAAFKREIMVWFRGLGLGFPIVSLFTLIRAYGKLRDDGQTTWDRDMSLRIDYESPTLFSLIAAGILFVIIVAAVLSTNG